MPVIKSAIKKLRKDKKLEKANDSFRQNLDQAVKKAKKTNSKDALSAAFSIVDKAVKKNLLHKNKAARIKASLTKNLPKAPAAAKSTPSQKEAPKKAEAKTTKKTPSKSK